MIHIAKTALALLAFALVATTLAARASGGAEAGPLSDKPTIVVLPFTSLGGDAHDAYLVDGWTDGLIADLSGVSGLFSIARNSSFPYRGREFNPSKISRELGVRWLVTGAVRNLGGRLRVAIRILDGHSGKATWSQVHEGSGQENLALRRQILAELLRALGVRLSEDESADLGQPETGNSQAYDAYLKGLYHYHRSTPDDFAQAVPAFLRAIELDPGYRPYLVKAGWAPNVLDMFSIEV